MSAKFINIDSVCQKTAYFFNLDLSENLNRQTIARKGVRNRKGRLPFDHLKLHRIRHNLILQTLKAE